MASFLDKVIVGINNGANSIKEGSKNMVEKANINTAIRNAEEDKKKLAELMGVQAYNLYLAGVTLPEELHNFCFEMKKRDDEIKTQKNNLTAIEMRSTTMSSTTIPAGKVCTCGFTNNPDAVFCAKCGNRIG